MMTIARRALVAFIEGITSFVYLVPEATAKMATANAVANASEAAAIEVQALSSELTQIRLAKKLEEQRADRLGKELSTARTQLTAAQNEARSLRTQLGRRPRQIQTPADVSRDLCGNE